MEANDEWKIIYVIIIWWKIQQVGSLSPVHGDTGRYPELVARRALFFPASGYRIQKADTKAKKKETGFWHNTPVNENFDDLACSRFNASDTFICSIWVEEAGFLTP